MKYTVKLNSLKKKLKLKKDIRQEKKNGSISDKKFRRALGFKKKALHIPNAILADKILRGSLDTNLIMTAKNKKFLNLLQGKHSDISVEKLIIKSFKNGKRQKVKKVKTEDKMIFKFKKEPEKNKTHWDHILEEMKWMQNDFEKERKMKKKFGHDMSKFCKKYFETKHIENEKTIKKREQDLIKKSNLLGRMVTNYWKKIEKVSKHQYGITLQENKIQHQQNRLLSFINKLQKISSKVSDCLNPNVMNQKSDEKESSTAISTNLNITSQLTEDNNLEKICVVVQKNEFGKYEVVDNEDVIIANAAQCAEKFQPTGVNLSASNVKTKVPFLIQHPLREYQHIGLDWLVTLHENKISGILADEMGLGKTIQTIAFIAHLACEKGIWGQHLIVVPTTIILNWEREFMRWCPALKTLCYYGNQKERKAKRYGWHKSKTFNVCITSYKLVIQDYSIFKRKKWYLIVLDEAQNIKNFKSKRWQMMLNFRAKRKLLLTGTPLQNDIMEIWSYMHFLMPNLFFSNEDFRDWFYNPFYKAIHYNSNLNKKLILTLHKILRPFLLRRLKKDVEKQLPEKIEHVIYCELTRRQRYLYDEYINSDNTQNTLQKNDYFSIMNVLMQLRKVCNHPDIFESRDYATPTRQLFNIFYFVPYLALTVFTKDPMKTINYKSLFLLFEEFEKNTVMDYYNLVKNYPTKPFLKIYKDIIKNKQILWTPNYLIGEGEVLFKKDYADSTILFESNTQNIKNTDESKHVLSLQSYVCATNIPLLQNYSVSHYLDIINNSYNDSKEYINSVFKENILHNKNKRDKIKLQVLYSNDLLSRKNILYKKPIFGNDLIKLIKLNLLANDFHFSKNIVYGNHYKKPYMKNIVYSSIFNKFYHGEKESKDIFYNNTNFEGVYPEMESCIEQTTNEILEAVELNNEVVEDKKQQLENKLINGNGVNVQNDEKEDKKEKEEKEEERQMEIEVEISEGSVKSGKVEKKVRFEEGEINPDDVKNGNLIKQKDGTKKVKRVILKQSQYGKKKNEDKFNENDNLLFNRKSTAPFIHEVKRDLTECLFNPSETVHFLNSDHFKSLIYTPQKFLNICEDLMQNFRIHIPNVISSGPRMISSKYNAEYNQTRNKYQMVYNGLNKIPSVQRYFSLFKTISFPDRKLVEFDSGKLIKLASLLKRLKSNKSKCLIFTQMTKMLDILEIFLNLHGYKYVRLDGSTKVEMRQTIVDRFNKNEKIFCFISSTRSGGIGLNLTAADSIVFIDTDWNPAMDKQAQDRCHRIGQTRTVHIYRLITLSTIEENIFKKSIQKREMNFVIMEDGKFDTDNFSKINFKSVVKEEHLLKEKEEEAAAELTTGRNMLEFENLKFENEEDQKNIEDLLIRIEDMEDVQAFKNASKEMLDEYEKENIEQQFINNEELDKENPNNEGKESLNSNLKRIDLYALNTFNKYYTFDDFVKEKEQKNNLNVAFLNKDLSESDEFDLGPSDDDEEKINKLDLDKAYEMYMSKKKQILKLYEDKKDDEV